jgi:hypothetical protein
VPKINVYLPNDLARQVRAQNLPVSNICQKALLEELARPYEPPAQQLRTGLLAVETGEDPVRVEQFRGVWLIEPEDGLGSDEPGADRGIYYGVAQTAKGRVAVYTYHVRNRFPPILTAYDTVDEAVGDGLPGNVARAYVETLGGVIYRDI